MKQAPRPVVRRLYAGKPGRSPGGTVMLAALSREYIANAGRLGSGPALGPQDIPFMRRGCRERGMDH
ncbi:MAG: hypothetical protein EKK53_15750 [Burkholderiales bacterium]|nr:MAG: hypothetical protein EKK53_15750 [Burkholderiales bacterium]